MIDESVKSKIYELEKAATEDYNNAPYLDEYLEGYRDGLHQAAKELSTAPTVDAVPVKWIETYMDSLGANGLLFNAMIIEKLLRDYKKRADGERKDGERKDDEHHGS